MDLGHVRDGLVAALDIVTPTNCAGCGRLDHVLCEECGAGLFGPPHRADTAAPLLRDGPPTWAAASYSGPVRDVVLAWKRGRRDIRPAIAEAAAELVDRWAALEPGLGRSVAVVPAPSGWVRRAKGLLVVAHLADAVAGALEAASPGTTATVADCLRRPGFGHLAGLGVGARAASRTAAGLRVRRLPAAETWVLVDDVVTTGATLRAAATALEHATGRPVAVAFALAATPPSRRRGM
jgi:predicted amidophosphoribosyltransferase